jgi:hypothetical protein
MKNTDLLNITLIDWCNLRRNLLTPSAESTLTVEAPNSSETPLLIYQTTRRHIPEVINLHIYRVRTSNSSNVSITWWVTFFRVSIDFSSKKAEGTKLDNSRGMLFGCRNCVLYRYVVHPVKQVSTNERFPDPSNVSSRCRASSQTPPTKKKNGRYKVA